MTRNDVGDPACWLDQVCEVCGRLPDTPDDPDGGCTCGPMTPLTPMTPGTPAALTDADYRALAEFRWSLRTFLGASETAAREAGLTPHQHQLLLAIRGWNGDGPPGVSELAERLNLQVHSAGELIARAESAGLLARDSDPADGRRQLLSLTEDGARRLAELTTFHRDELRGLRRRMLEVLDRLERPDTGSRHSP